MSALTKTAVSYASIFAILLLLVLPAVGRGDVISEIFEGIAKILLVLLMISGALSILFELLLRKASFSRLPDFTMNVSLVRAAAHLLFVTYGLSLVVQFDKWGLSYLLFAVVMTHNVVSRKKRKNETVF